MVASSVIRESNSQISQRLPVGLVAVFAGGTSGIGEYAAKEFARHAKAPKIYLLGRSKDAADRIIAECSEINPEGKYIFLQADMSLLKGVDEVCKTIREREKAINLLHLTIGSIATNRGTAEGLEYASALLVYCRTRLTINLLPLLKNAQHLRRVVTTFNGSREGAEIDMDDFDARKMGVSNIMFYIGHLASTVTLALVPLAEQAPEVSFVHNFPGNVRGGVTREATNPVIVALGWIFKYIGPLIWMPDAESGQRHLYLATSAAFPAKEPGQANQGVPVNGAEVAAGLDGKQGSGVYSVNATCDVSAQSAQIISKLLGDGREKNVWQRISETMVRITGSVSLS